MEDLALCHERVHGEVDVSEPIDSAGDVGNLDRHQDSSRREIYAAGKRDQQFEGQRSAKGILPSGRLRLYANKRRDGRRAWRTSPAPQACGVADAADSAAGLGRVRTVTTVSHTAILLALQCCAAVDSLSRARPPGWNSV